MQLPIPYTADRARAERIMLAAAERHTVQITELSEKMLRELGRRYFMRPSDVKPRVYFRLTDNWLELTVRFVARDYGVRELKDRLSRDILRGFEEVGITIASTTIDIVGLPPVRAAIEKATSDPLFLFSLRAFRVLCGEKSFFGFPAKGRIDHEDHEVNCLWFFPLSPSSSSW